MDLINAELNKLKEIKKPNDLVESAILQETPHELKLLSSNAKKELEGLPVEKIYFVRKKNFKKNYNLNNSGHFEESNYNTSSFKSDRSYSYVWFVRKDERDEGPFTDSDIKKLIIDGKLTDTLIKRDFDKGFVEYNKLVSVNPHFYNQKNLTQFFKENQIIINYNEKEKEREREKEKETIMISLDFSQNFKLMNFLDNNNISIEPMILIQSIMGLKKQDAIELLKDITGLEKPDICILIQLLIKDLNMQILSDVDKSGFMINKNNYNNKNRKYK